MKIYLDDERPTPEGWARVYTPEEAIECLKTGLVTEMSLDHDLGLEGDRTGYQVLLWLEEEVALRAFTPPKLYIHSANSSARIKMELAVEKINQFHHHV